MTEMTLILRHFFAAVSSLIVVMPYTNARAQSRPWCNGGVSQSIPDTKTTAELKRKLAAASNVAGEDHSLKRLQPISLSIVLSGTVQPDSVVEERDERRWLISCSFSCNQSWIMWAGQGFRSTHKIPRYKTRKTMVPRPVSNHSFRDITLCLQLDDESRKKLQEEIGNPSRVPTEIHIEMVAYARDRAGNTVFRGWQKREEDRVLFNDSPVVVDTGGRSIQFKNLAAADKHLDGKRIEVTGAWL
jgi:hypothetical protein